MPLEQFVCPNPDCKWRFEAGVTADTDVILCPRCRRKFPVAKSRHTSPPREWDRSVPQSGPSCPPSRGEPIPRNRFTEYAAKAVESRVTIRIPPRDADAFVKAVLDALIRIKGMSPAQAATAAMDRVTLRCPRCGGYDENLKFTILLSGAGGAFDQVLAGGGTVVTGPTTSSALAGRCPRCRASEIELTFDPPHARKDLPVAGEEARQIDFRQGRADEKG